MYVSIGGPMFLIVIGAILYWATDFELAKVDMNTVGLIVMIAGVVILIFSIGQALFRRGDRGGPRPPSGRPPSRY